MAVFQWFRSGVLAATVLLLACAPCAPAAQAQRWAALADTVVRHVARDSELPGSTVATSLAEDGAGFLWIGTQDGLVRFDGYRFRTYRADPALPGSLPDNYIKALRTDRQGRLWTGTSAGGLARYDSESDRFITYPAGPHGLSHVCVRDMVDDGSGGMWVATDGGLDHLLASGGITHIRTDSQLPGGLPDDHIRALFLDRDGTLWVGTAAGLARLDEHLGHFNTVRLPAADGKPALVSTLFQDSRGSLWVGTSRNGAYVIDFPGARPRAVLESPPARSTLQGEGVRAIAEARPGKIWLGTLAHGIVEISLDTGNTRRILHDPALQDSLADDSVQALHKDRSGLLWIATDRELSFYDADQQGAYTLFGGSTQHAGISASDVDAVLQMPDGRLWLGLEARGIDIIDPNGQRVGALRPDAARPHSALPNDYVNAFARTPGHVYVGTERGLYRVDRHAHRVRRVSLPRRDPSAPVHALLALPGVLWVGGLDGLRGLALTADRARVARLSQDIKGLSDQRVTVIERGPAGSLWVGTKNGLNRVEPQTGVVQQALPDPHDQEALPTGYVSSLLTDRQGRLWVGTLGGGIGLVEQPAPDARPRFRHLGSKQGLASENINKLLEDATGRIWASTDDGLAVIDAQTLAVRTVRRAEGVPIGVYWIGSGIVTDAAELVFGGLQGLTVVLPDRLVPWSYHPPLVITDLMIGGKHVPSSPRGPKQASPLTIRPDANSIAVEFAALDYSAPERNRYAYKLEGFDADWIETEPARRLAAYTNLPPGQYRLILRGSNREGSWTEAAVMLPIRVLPAWFETAWFRLLIALVALGLVLAIVHVRTLYLRGMQRKLEQQVSERTAELRESQRQLEQIAYCDTLTALPNRRMFMEEFRKLLAFCALQRVGFALLLIDLDRLKQVNDTLGHDVGDAVLIEAAARLRAAVRKSDRVARLGGDEFAVLLTQNPATADIEAVCRRIVDSFAGGIRVNDTAVASSPSVGVAVYPEDGSQEDLLYKSADLALYEAKRSGGNAWCWFRSMAACETTRLE
jgi:diguanylate cyclase (GGDEF)-like protein